MSVPVVPASGDFREAREPQTAVAPNGGGVFVAFGVGDQLFCAASNDGGRRFAAPTMLPASCHLSLGMRRGPRIAAAKGTTVISAVNGRQGGGRDGDLLAWRSVDRGRTWQGPSRVSDVPGAAREGLHAMTAAPDGTLACVWLDLREKGTQIFASLSRDGGKTWGKNARVYRSPDGTVCECCHPSVAFGRRGELVVMWRNWLGGARDMYLTRSRDGGKTFAPAQKLGVGTWPLNACPMDGGGLAVAPNGATATLWRREEEMYLCDPGSPERRLGVGQQGWLAAHEKGLYAVWLRGRPGTLLAQTPTAPAPVELARNANDPALAAPPSGPGPLIAVWQEEGVSAPIRAMTL